MSTTNIPRSVSIRPGECTEFQLHKSQLTIFNKILRKVHDFSEFKLKKHIDNVKDLQQKLVLISLLQDYMTGHVAIAWKKGQPIWVKVTKEIEQ